jgi:hypothetical protein
MTKKQLIAKCTDLGIDSSGLDTNTQLEAAIATKETELAAMDVKAEAEKVAANAKKAEAKKAAAEAKKEPAFYEDKRGRKWIFKPTAPKKLNIDGHPMSQEEILETEEVVSELVYGNCAFLTQKL